MKPCPKAQRLTKTNVSLYCWTEPTYCPLETRNCKEYRARPCSAEDSAVVATALLNNWLARVKTPALLDCIVEFLLVCTSKSCTHWWKIMRAVIFYCEQESATFLDAAASSRFF
jgi:hypothetical protein